MVDDTSMESLYSLAPNTKTCQPLASLISWLLYNYCLPCSFVVVVDVVVVAAFDPLSVIQTKHFCLLLNRMAT